MFPDSVKLPTFANQSLEQYVVDFKKITGLDCYCPEVRDGDTRKPVSKYFGLPWLAKDESWPEIEGVKPVFVLQLEIASLPHPFRPALGGEGLLQFFYAVDGPYENSALVRIVHPNGLDSFAAHNEADNKSPEWRPKRIVGWSKSADYPRIEHLENICDTDFDEISEAFDVDIGEEVEFCIQGDKLGGWPFWTQGVEIPKNEYGEPMDYVLQLDAGCFFDGPTFPAHAPELFASDGTGHIFVSRSNPKVLKFVWACT